MAYGDVERAFATAAHVFEEDIFQHRGAAMTLEGRAVLAHQEPASGVLTVWSATQTPHICRATIADLLERSPDEVRVIAPFVGGGFGTKAPFYPEEIVIPVAALRLGRPVKWIEDRREHFLSSTQERDQYWKVAIAVDGDGKILGLRGTMIHDNGAYLPWGIIAPYIASTTFPGPYVVPAFKFETTVVLTNRVPTTVVRGAGRPQAVFAMERLIDRVARELGIDRAELRRRNMITPAQMPYHVGLVFRDGKPLVYASGDFPLSQTRAIALARLRRLPRRARRLRARPAAMSGSASAITSRAPGSGPSKASPCAFCATARSRSRPAPPRRGRAPTRRCRRSSPIGSAVAIADIALTAGDTAAISQGVGAFASRQAINAGSSAMMAGDTVRQQVVALAARILGVPESEIDVEDGRAIARGGNKPTLTFAELAQARPGHAGVLDGAGPDTRARAHRLVHAAAGVLLQRHPHRRSRGRSRDRRRAHLELRGRARQRRRDQSDDRRRPGPGRRRPRHRQCAVRVHALRRRCPAADHELRRLPHADGARGAGLRYRARRDAEPAQPARRQRRRRRRHHPGAGRDHRRDRGCALPVRRAFRRDAAHARPHRRRYSAMPAPTIEPGPP